MIPESRASGWRWAILILSPLRELGDPSHCRSCLPRIPITLRQTYKVRVFPNSGDHYPRGCPSQVSPAPSAISVILDMAFSSSTSKITPGKSKDDITTTGPPTAEKTSAPMQPITVRHNGCGCEINPSMPSVQNHSATSERKTMADKRKVLFNREARGNVFVTYDSELSAPS